MVLVENQEVVLEAGPHVGQLRAHTITLARQQIVVVRTQPADHAGLARFEAHDLCVFAAHKKEGELVQVGQPLVLAVYFPIIRIALQDHALPGHVLLQTKRPQPGDLARRCVQ